MNEESPKEEKEEEAENGLPKELIQDLIIIFEGLLRIF